MAEIVELANLLNSYKAEMDIMKGEIGYLQRRADRFDAYQQMHLRSMNDFSNFIVTNPPENLPIIDDGDAETIVEEPVGGMEARVQSVKDVAAEKSREKNTAVERLNQPTTAPAQTQVHEQAQAQVQAPVLAPQEPPGTPTDYNYDEKDEHLSDGEVRDVSAPSTPNTPKEPMEVPPSRRCQSYERSVAGDAREDRSMRREEPFYRPRLSLFEINTAKALENATRRNRIPNPCRDMRRPGGCLRGDTCQYSHNVVPYSYCYKYNDTGHCGVRDCRFLHQLYEYVPLERRQPTDERPHTGTDRLHAAPASYHAESPPRRRSPSRDSRGLHRYQQDGLRDPAESDHGQKQGQEYRWSKYGPPDQRPPPPPPAYPPPHQARDTDQQAPPRDYSAGKRSRSWSPGRRDHQDSQSRSVCAPGGALSGGDANRDRSPPRNRGRFE